jgi:thymidylate synthase (FAD)
MFKTIEQCRLDLVAHSVKAGAYFKEDSELLALEPDQNLDYFPASAARVSFGKEDKTGKDKTADSKLMKYLAEHEHMTPFEHQSATFLIEVPLFIRSQIHRHRTFAYNEISRRYTDENLEFWIPDKFRKQAESNRQASTDETVGPFLLGAPGDLAAYEERYGKIPLTDPVDYYKIWIKNQLGVYTNLISAGCSREQARALLPQSLLTKFYMTGNLRNWAHFVRLRDDEHAQQEVRVPAQRIDKILQGLWPTAWGVLRGV